jgi:hypothetical protein
MSNKHKNWDFAYIVTTISATVYTIVWCINWVLVTFLKFTYLDLVLIAWVTWSLGNVVTMYVHERDFRAGEEEDDEHKFL